MAASSQQEKHETNFESTNDYYICVFKKLKNENKDTWNWSAALFFTGWLLYRKMYLYSILISTLWLFWHVILYRLFGDNPIVATITAIIEILLFGYYGNRLYYRSVNKKIENGFHQLKNHQSCSIPLAVFPGLLWGGLLVSGFSTNETILLSYLITIILTAIYSCADWAANRENRQKYSVTEKSYRQYFTSSNKMHIPEIIATVCSCICVFISMSICTSKNSISQKAVEQQAISSSEEAHKGAVQKEKNNEEKSTPSNDVKKQTNN